MVSKTYRTGANVASTGAHNRKIVLSAIREKRSVFRYEIAQSTGLTPPAIYKITQQLLAEGFIVCSTVRDGTRGQPAQSIQINPDAAFSIGLNIDSDQVTLLAVDYEGQARFHRSRTVDPAAPDTVNNFIKSSISELDSLDLFPRSVLAGIGVALPDPINKVCTTDTPANYKESAIREAIDEIKNQFNVPVYCENNTAAAVTGELALGHGVSIDSYFYLYLGARLGAGVIINSNYIRGAHGRSGEIHLLPQVNPLKTSDRNCNRDLGEAASLRVLIDRLNASSSYEITLQSLKYHVDSSEIIKQWVEDLADLLCLPLLTVIAVIDPALIVLGRVDEFR